MLKILPYGEVKINAKTGHKSHIVFEAKCTESGRMNRDVISSEQEKQLDLHERLGAACYVMVSFSFAHFFKIPWTVFRDMKQHYGRKYITPADAQEYKVPFIGGVVHFLDTEDIG